ncbi:MAG: 50S ribosomal protein L5 [Candidatus Alkanophagales archaeon]
MSVDVAAAVAAARRRRENPMRRVEIDKVVVNIGVGESGEKLAKAEKVLTMITGQKPLKTLAKKTIQPFGIKRGEPIGVKVTLRGERAKEFLRKAFKVQNKFFDWQFDEFGNFSFGIEEHMDLGVPYDPDIGIFGMDVCVSFKRPGFRITERKIQRKRRIPSRHRVTKAEVIEYLKREFGVEVVKE